MSASETRTGMPPFPSVEAFAPLILLAKTEDMGEPPDDCTSRLTFDDQRRGVGTVVQKQAGVICGLPIIEHVCRVYDERLKVQTLQDQPIESIEARFSDRLPMPLVQIRGPMRALLAAERVLLNILQHMSGVATLTRQFVREIEGTGATLVDTRKTLPGFRALDKYAVLCGGAANHRVGLYDMVLMKDNHLAGFSPEPMPETVRSIIERSRAEAPDRKIEVEVDSLDQLRLLLAMEGIDFILLDNMDCATMRKAVAMRDGADKCGRVLLEASGGVSLKTVREIAQTGVDRISVGYITHSAPGLDIGLDLALA